MDAGDCGARSRGVRVTGRPAAGLAAAVLALLVLGCAVFTAFSRGIIAARWTLLVVILVWLLCLALLAALSWAFLSRRSTAVLVAGLALTMQGLALAGGAPLLSDDLYRYVWDAQVAAHGTDPYAVAPADPSLVPLRTPELWPSAGDCARPRADLPRTALTSPFIGVDRAGGCTLLNRPAVRTIYPPAAQLAFRVGNAVVPDRLAVERKAQLPAIVTSLLLTGALLLLGRRTGQHPAYVLLYAASPLAMVEAGTDAHIDVLAALLGVGVVWLLSRDRPGRAGLTAIGVVLSLAVMTKLYPAALGVLVVARFRVRSLQTWYVGAVTVAVAALLYVPHVVAVGIDVLGYLPGYLRENEYSSGGRYVLLSAALPQPLEPLAPVLAALAVAAIVLLGCRPVGVQLTAIARRGAFVIGAAMFVLTPGNAWYCALLLSLAVIAARPEWLAVVAANYCTYWTALLNGPRWITTGSYLVALLVVAGAAAWRAGPLRTQRRPGSSRLPAEPPPVRPPGPPSRLRPGL